MVQLAALRTELDAVADERGLPVSWPLLDLEDLNAVDFQDVWGGFEERGSRGIAVATVPMRSSRSSAARARRQRRSMVALVDGGGTPVQGTEARDGLDAAADRFARSSRRRRRGGRSITVLNVQSSADYGRVHQLSRGQSVLAVGRRGEFRAGRAQFARRRRAAMPACSSEYSSTRRRVGSGDGVRPDSPRGFTLGSCARGRSP